MTAALFRSGDRISYRLRLLNDRVSAWVVRVYESDNSSLRYYTLRIIETGILRDREETYLIEQGAVKLCGLDET